MSNLNIEQGRSIDPPICKTNVPENNSQNDELGEAFEVNPTQTVESIHTNRNANIGDYMNNVTGSKTDDNSKTLNVYDINKIREIDFAKCVSESGVDYNSIEWGRVNNAEESALFRIVGFNNLPNELVKNLLKKSFFTQLKKHAKHKFIISETLMKDIWNDGHYGSEIIRNLWTEVIIENEDQLQKFDLECAFTEDMKFVHLKLPMENAKPEFFDKMNWVVLELPDSPSDDVILQAREIVERRNDKNKPVWIYEAQIRTKIMSSDKVTVKDNAISEPLYFDLPSKLVSKSDETKGKAKRICENIASIAGKLSKAQLEIGYRLSWLDFMAREAGKSQFWNQNFERRNRSEFCLEDLKIRPDVASQYLTAIRHIEILRPGMLSQVFDSAKDNADGLTIPHGYTRYRDLKKYMPYIISLQEHEGYSTIIQMIFDPMKSNRELMKDLPAKIEAYRCEPLPGDPQKVFDAIAHVGQLSEKMKTHVPDEQKVRFNTLIKELTTILQSINGSGTTEESKEEVPEQEIEKVSNTDHDTDSIVLKEAA